MFAEMLCEVIKGQGDKPFPYEFGASADEGPLSVEFLEAIGMSQKDAQKEARQFQKEERRRKLEDPRRREPERQRSGRTKSDKEATEYLERTASLPIKHQERMDRSRRPVASSSATQCSSKAAVLEVPSIDQSLWQSTVRGGDDAYNADLRTRLAAPGSKTGTSGKDDGNTKPVRVETPVTMDHKQALVKSRKEWECILQSEDLLRVLQQKSVVPDFVQSSVTFPPRPGAVGAKRKTPPTQQTPRGQNSGSRSRGSTRNPYHKVPELTEVDANMMNRVFMNRVWREQVEPRIPHEPVTEPWEVRILMEQAHLLDSTKEELYGLVSHSSVRFYAHENGDFLHVGVWVRSTQSQDLHAFGASQQIILHYSYENGQ